MLVDTVQRLWWFWIFFIDNKINMFCILIIEKLFDVNLIIKRTQYDGEILLIIYVDIYIL